ncbi:hypothetical protein CP04DC42_0087 [Chlamydia psittaci 04DC42]|nr:hypothetical protein CP04DC42_0087 [Chlamydia psittaci 04DC42]EPJ29125.1 hypothetical protein CPC1998_0450 [Chlamydia psittaci C19/98]
MYRCICNQFRGKALASRKKMQHKLFKINKKEPLFSAI